MQRVPKTPFVGHTFPNVHWCILTSPMAKLWIIRILSVALSVSILILILYRVSIWYSQNMVSFLTPSNAHINDSSSTATWSSSEIPITLCNLNPIRGDLLFELPNGSRLYDFLVDKWHKAAISYRDDSMKFLPKSVIESASHKLESMLRWCYLGLESCHAQDFHRIWASNRLCDQLILKKKDTSLTLALDAEEMHYLIPGYGFVGFKLCIGNIIQTNMKHPFQECFYISNKLHTIIGVTRSVISDGSDCSVSSFDECRSKCFAFTNFNCSCYKYLKNCQFSHQISSNLQAAPSPFFYHLFKMHHFKQNYQVCESLIPTLIQWRGVLRFLRPDLFHQMVEISKLLRGIQARQSKLSFQVRNLQHNISSDLVRLKHIKDDSKLCDLPNLLDKLNKTCNMFHNELPVHNYSFPACKSHVHISGSFELTVIEMLFSKTPTSIFDNYFRKKLNQLSMLNIELKTQTSPFSCSNSIIQKMGAFYIQEIIDTRSDLNDFSISSLYFQKRILSLQNLSAEIMSTIIHKRRPNKDKNSLITVTIDVQTNSRQILPKPIQYKQNTVPLTVVSELIDIICSSAAVAALFIFIVRCLRSPRVRSKTKTRKRVNNSSLRQQRSSGTTQTEILRDDDIIISPVTFTL